MLRKVFAKIHLWLGIASSLVLFVVCLSGTVYTFRSEIEFLFEREKYVVQQSETTARMDADEVAAGMASYGQVLSLRVPANPSRSYQLRIKTGPDDRRGTTYFVHPYTGEVLGQGGGAVGNFFGWTMRLHRWLLMGKTGKIIVGVATLVFIVLMISGLVIWFPRRFKNWKRGLKISFRGSWRTTNRDLHNALGFYTLPLLLVMALTGLNWSFDWYRDGMSKVLGAPVFNRGGAPTTLTVGRSLQAQSSEDLLRLAQSAWGKKADYQIHFSQSEEQAVRISRYNTGFFAFAGADHMEIDPYTAQIVSMKKFSEQDFNVKLASLIKPLHTGEIYGAFSKILYFLACLVATSLPLTGLIIWINKL